MQKHILEYASESRRLRWGGTDALAFLLALAFGVLQFPCWASVTYRMLDWVSMRPVDFFRDSMLILASLSCTIPAIACSAYCGIAHLKVARRLNWSVLVCGLVFLISLLPVLVGADMWLNDVFFNQHGSWGLW
jgi:hypothetical protein